MDSKMDKPVNRRAQVELERDPLLQAATEWFVELRSNDVSGERVAEWQQWLSADHAHLLAFERVESFWRLGSQVEGVRWPTDDEVTADAYRGDGSISEWLGQGAVAPALFRREIISKTRGLAPLNRWALAAGFAAIGLFLVLILNWTGVRTWSQLNALVFDRPDVSVETAVGETRTFLLPDGSTLAVGGRTKIEARFSATARNVRLENGEAFFHVAKDPARPFIVSAGETSVTAVGTAFNVRRAGDHVVVAVSEGVVQVKEERPEGSKTRLVAGQQLSARQRSATGAAPDLLPVDAQSVAGWRDGRLQYLNEPLDTVVQDIARYTSMEIHIADPKVRSLRVTGIVFQKNIDGWLSSLEATFPVRVLREPDGSVNLESRSID